MPRLNCAAYEGIRGFGSADVWLGGGVFAAAKAVVLGADVGRNGADRSACVRCESALGRALPGRGCVPLFGREVFCGGGVSLLWLVSDAWWRCGAVQPVAGGGDGVSQDSQSRVAGACRLSRRTYALGLPPPRRPEGQSPRPRCPRLAQGRRTDTTIQHWLKDSNRRSKPDRLKNSNLGRDKNPKASR